MKKTKQKIIDLAYYKYGIKANENINFQQVFEILDEIQALENQEDTIFNNNKDWN